MIVSNIDDLSWFLSRWYGVPDLSLSPEAIPPDAVVPEALRLAWLKIGRLSVGYEDWLRTGRPSPLACQDGFAAPGRLHVRNGYTQVVTENQGNWAIGYETGSKLTDPPVFSDFLEQESGGTGFVPLGCNLSDLIITSVLAETVFFGAASIANPEDHAKECTRVVWTGHYYNAVGYGKEYQSPSHQIRTNRKENLLGLYWEETFSGFIATNEDSRTNLKQYL